MRFDFPRGARTITMSMKFSEETAGKLRTLATKNSLLISEIINTIIEEALVDYESQYGPIEPKEGKKIFSIKRDRYKAGDNLNKREPEQKKVFKKGSVKKISDMTERERRDYYKEAYLDNLKNAPPKELFCQYVECPSRLVKIPFENMLFYNRFAFCSVECRDEYIDLNKEGGEQ